MRLAALSEDNSRMPAKTCPICAKRRGKRHCPGLAASRWAGSSEIICAQCCGAQREVSIDCPADCPYLVAAHRYESERPAAPPPELPFADVSLDTAFLEEHQQLLASLNLALCRFAAEQPGLRDPDLLAALDALARGYQTLESGLYYEQPPEAAPARALYAAAREFLEQYSQEQQKQSGASLRPGEVVRALVFFRRLGAREANGRPLSRAFLNFLRAQLPAEAQSPAAPRLIVPGR